MDKALIKVFSEYTDFIYIFLPILITELSQHTGINNHTIKLIDNWQALYSFIYSLSLLKLEILKDYIENNLANGFIRPFQFSIRVFILCDQKSGKSLRLCIDYWDFNNLIIQNRYFLLLVKELLN